jgi:hypothetical protein
MIWLTWRQFRAQAIAAAAAVAVLGVIFGVTGPHLAHLYDISGLASCRVGCSALTSTFLDSMKADAVYPVLYIAGIGILYVTPAIIGMFWGAPLVTRELEAGTFRLAWNQSVYQTITPAGRVFVLPDVPACASGTQQQCDAWLATQHLRRQVSYQPASRFWAFQWYETAIFLGFALALAGFCVWQIRHRRLS